VLDRQPGRSDAVPPLAGIVDLAGRVVLVTGARGGIGAGIAARFTEAGATVVRHLGRTPRPGDPEGVTAELTDPEAVAAVVGAIAERWGRLDVVVANAADQRLAPLADQDPASWAEVLAANVTSVAELVRVAAPHLAAGGAGSVVAVASIEAFQPAPGHGAYAASKAALVQLVRAAAGEYGPSGVRVNAVCPGLIDRPGLERDWPEGVRRWRAAAPLGRLGTPADVADACLFLASPLARWVTGAALVVDGGVLTRPTW
jgi:NAD(P)-dependent dehydrogenase (short-subunit alcohol dehydrogenase family)